MWTWEDVSDMPALVCDNCGAIVSPEAIEYITYSNIGWASLGSFVAWTCQNCGHTRMSAISADVPEGELEELERQEESGWLLEHQYVEY